MISDGQITCHSQIILWTKEEAVEEFHLDGIMVFHLNTTAITNTSACLVLKEGISTHFLSRTK